VREVRGKRREERDERKEARGERREVRYERRAKELIWLFSFLFPLVSLLGPWTAEAQPEPPASEKYLQFSDPAKQQRFKHLLEELRCLVCQNQTLADSDAALAHDLRREVYTLIEKGASDREIKEFVVNRYGDFVLYRPPVKTTTYLLWFGPFLLLILGVFVLVYFIRGRRAEPQPTLTEEERARLDQILGRTQAKGGR
jgi:cytochrome c-type biogenesis protein CcmH